MVNDDPYYYSVYISQIYSVYETNRVPRLFISDNNYDKFPDIVTGDSKDNSIGFLFNPGQKFWDKAKIYYIENNYDNNKIYREKVWTYIPLYNIYQYKLNDKKLLDYQLIPVKHSSTKRINFEIFAVYEIGVYWFIEEKLNFTPSIISYSRSQQKNYIYCMVKADIIIDKSSKIELEAINDNEKEKEKNNNLNDEKRYYSMIVSTDINNDYFNEFILYSIDSLYLIKKYTPYISGFGWNSGFWIYICIYIYIISSIIGLCEFYKLSGLLKNINETEEFLSEKKSTYTVNNQVKSNTNNLSVHSSHDKSKVRKITESEMKNYNKQSIIKEEEYTPRSENI